MRTPKPSAPAFHRLAGALFLCLALASLTVRAVQPLPSPTEQIQFSIDAVIAVLKDESLGSEAKDAKIRAIIEDRFRGRYNHIIKRQGMESLLLQLEKKLEAANTVTN